MKTYFMNHSYIVIFSHICMIELYNRKIHFTGIESVLHLQYSDFNQFLNEYKKWLIESEGENQ